jgi:hypothetical protein
MEERRQADERFINHEKRLNELEVVVFETLQWHHRNDRMLERMNNAETAIEHLQSGVGAPKRNGNGVETRLRWVEKVIWMAIGGFAVFEFFSRFFK